MNHVTYSVSSTDISVFLEEISNFAMSRNTDFFIFFWVFEDCFNKCGYCLDDISKNGYSRPFWNKVLRNKVYGVIISRHDVTNKILSRKSNYIVNIAKFCNSSNSMREIIKDLIKKTLFWRAVFVEIQYLRTEARHGLEMLKQCVKRWKLKVRKIWGLNSSFVEVTGEKLVGEELFAPPTRTEIKV